MRRILQTLMVLFPGALVLAGCSESASPEVTITDRMAANHAMPIFKAAFDNDCASLIPGQVTQEGRDQIGICIDKVVEQHGNFIAWDDTGKQAVKERLINEIIQPQEP